MKDKKQIGHGTRGKKGLNRTRQEWESIFEAIGHPAVILDPHCKVIAANSASVKMTGKPRNEIIGKRCYEIFHGKDAKAPPQNCPMEAMLKSGRLETIDIEMEALGGFFLVSCTPVFDEQGNLEKVIHIATDITQRKKDLETIMRERDFSNSVLNSLPGIFYLFDQAGGFLRWNSNFEQVSGFSSEEISRMSPLDFFIGPDRELIQDRIRNVLFDGYVDVEAELVSKNGKRTPYFFTGRLLEIEGKPCVIGMGLDISARKRMEEALLESRRHASLLANLLERSSQPFTLGYPDGRLGICNEAFCQLLGYTKEELLALDWARDITPTEWLEKEQSFLEELHRSGQPVRYEKEYIRKDGSRVPIELFVHMVKDENGQPRYYYAFVTDITERKQAGEEAAWRSKQLQILARATQEINTVLDIPVIMRNLVAYAMELTGAASGAAGLMENGRMVFTEYNQGARTFPVDYRFTAGYGVPGHVMQTKQPYLSNDAEHDPHVIPEIRKALGFTTLANVPILDKQGDILGCFELHNKRNNAPFDHQDVELLKALSASAAIALENAQILAEQRRAEEKFRALFEESKDVVYISTPDGKFIDINPAGVALFAYASKEELLSTDIAQQLYVNPEEKLKFMETMELQGFVKDYEVKMRKKGGDDTLTVAITGVAVKDDTGKIVAYRGSMRDLTEHRKLEEQLLQSQKLEAIGQLAGGVAHDFNNILSAIVGYAHLTLMKMPKDDSLRGNLDLILQASERATTLTQSLLSFSRKQFINPEFHSLNDIVKRLRKFLVRLIREDIEITTTYSKNDPTILADSGQIENMLMNLVTNARDAMPEGGRIVIRTESVEMDQAFIDAHGYGKTGAYALLSVSDSGIGMDAKTKERIFEPFFTTKEQGKGTGLGLSMVYGIVKQHHGYINVYSEPDNGTTFKIFLPRFGDVIAAKRKEAERVPMRGGSETILVAEDDAALRNLASIVLRQFGYSVIEAVDGEDAVAKYRENKDHVQLVILDGIMPKKNGNEACREIRSITPSIKTIFVSGYSEDIITKEGLLEPGIIFILKPVTPSELVKKVREVLDA